MRNLFLSITLVLVLFSCNNNNPEKKEIDKTAEELVELILTAGTFDSDLVDAYYGDIEIDTSKRYKKTKVIGNLKALYYKLNSLEIDSSSFSFIRKKYQMGIINALITRLKILNGEHIPFQLEAENIYQFKPKLMPVEYFDSVRNEMDNLLPGIGGFKGRFSEFRRRFKIPEEKLDEVIKLSVDYARDVTKKHIELPENENLKIEYLSGKPWSAYNWYKGDYQSLIEINTSNEIFVERALDLAAHESYPGHHVFFAFREKRFYRDSGFVEFSIYPLFSPVSFLAEGTAEYGIDLVYPGDEKIKFVKEKIAPVIDLDTSGISDYFRVLRLMEELDKAAVNAAILFLDGEKTRQETIDYLVEVGLESENSADHRLKFIRKYRSYIINYSYGKELVKKFIEEKAGNSEEKKWLLYKELIEVPYLPRDLQSF